MGVERSRPDTDHVFVPHAHPPHPVTVEVEEVQVLGVTAIPVHVTEPSPVIGVGIVGAGRPGLTHDFGRGIRRPHGGLSVDEQRHPLVPVGLELSGRPQHETTGIEGHHLRVGPQAGREREHRERQQRGPRNDDPRAAPDESPRHPCDGGGLPAVVGRADGLTLVETESQRGERPPGQRHEREWHGQPLVGKIRREQRLGDQPEPVDQKARDRLVEQQADRDRHDHLDADQRPGQHAGLASLPGREPHRTDHRQVVHAALRS